MNIRAYFREARNKRRIHIEQLRQIRDREDTDQAVRKKLDKKIKYEQQQLETINDIWST